MSDCEQALQTLAGRLQAESGRRRSGFDRTLSCSLTDPDVIFSGRFEAGLLVGVQQTEDPAAQIRLRLSGDDLLDLVDGKLNVAAAVAAGRLKIDAGMLDLVRLRSVF